MTTDWACPKCAATCDKHGKGGADACLDAFGVKLRSCMGFLCECEEDTEASHGNSASDPCPSAHCYHCGWTGMFPPKPKKLKGWEKTAWDAGWRPPAGWKL